jgi:hypothetical protein
MIMMDIKAPEIYSEGTNSVIESDKIITITLSGDTFKIKDEIKELGFKWDGSSEWYYTVDREWFKANGYAFVRKVAKAFKCRPNIIGAQAKAAVNTMDK